MGKIFPTIADVIAANATERYHDERICLEPVDTGENSVDEKSVGEKSVSVNSVHQITGHFEIGAQYHYTMETQSCVCIPTDQGLNVYTSTQWMDNVHIAISEVLKIPQNMINLSVKRLGGGYGAKISRPGQIACACALASHLLNRPVRFVLSLESNMTAIGKRYACVNDFEVETDDNGVIQKLSNTFTEDYGSSLNEPPEAAVTEFFSNCYRKETWKITARKAKTDAPSHTWCRSPGTTEGIAMIENIMEHIAKTTGKDPIAVRLANMTEDNQLRKILPKFLKSIGKD